MKLSKKKKKADLVAKTYTSKLLASDRKEPYGSSDI